MLLFVDSIYFLSFILENVMEKLSLHLLLFTLGIHVCAFIKASSFIKRKISKICDIDFAGTSFLQHLFQMDHVPGFLFLPFGPCDIEVFIVRPMS